MTIERARGFDVNGDCWLVNIHYGANSCLRVFLKTWAWPYRSYGYSHWCFGGGPLGCMWWKGQ